MRQLRTLKESKLIEISLLLNSLKKDCSRWFYLKMLKGSLSVAMKVKLRAQEMNPSWNGFMKSFFSRTRAHTSSIFNNTLK